MINNRWRTNFIFGALVALLVTQSAALSKDSVPQWVKDAAAQTLPSYPPETDAVTLLKDTTLTVQGPGHATWHYRVAIKILRPQGRELAHLGTYFDKDSRISWMKIWTLGSDGHEYQLPDNQIENIGFGGGNLYEDTKWRGGKAMANDPGAVVAMEFDQDERPYVTEDIWRFQSDIPVRRATYTLKLPSDFEYRAVWVRHAGIEPTSIGPNQWQWNLTDVPAIDVRHVSLHPAPAAMEQRMSVHYFGPGVVTPLRGNWVSIGEWYSQLTADRFTPSPEITAKANELTAGKIGFYPKAEAIASFLQRNIRYFSIEIGVGGYQPHLAAETFKNRYGDCKDKATLLLSMLGVVGIHGHLVMVDDRRGVLDPISPSIFGNHIIAAIEVPEGADVSHLHSLVKLENGNRYLIFDPTQEWIPFGEIPSYEQGGYGLMIDGKESQIVALPLLKPELSILSRSAKFKLHEDGTLSGDVTEYRSGDSAWGRRASFTRDDKREREGWLDHHISQDLSNFTVADFSVANLQELDKQLELKYQVTTTQYSKAMGPLLLLRPRVLGKDGPQLEHEAKRTMAVDLDGTRVEHDDFSIELPEGYSVDELPDPVKLDLGFASYESATTVEANTLHYTRTFTVREVELPASRYPDLVKMATVIHADEQGSAVFKHMR